ncbi:1,2-phenylacetyl-CoA epoxidase subunit PaaE [Spongiactinospora sp. TRM90649]|uniref:1,2-phenylacetyl-CoA epoxidase subunit PaaE n=1 Tax=Spongiactinospora sp. TRM90649 TaxID=3031114 RepID=UPI0023F6DE19|nr:1,2-phenylacetyl-CoA epoxidase subunit PaaE [Spongiactinospora sp. TRM90649]MDF5753589.1 phenylacetate-CoA oxygenase/reductase subunit PaaK [Spongiactinospora sp. TRM90649]
MSGFHALAVDRVERLCDDAVAITFAVPAELTGTFAFRPGQFLTLRRVVDGREERRSYSICAPDGEAPRIGVREVPDGLFSSWLVREVGPGDVIEALPPAGSFTPDLARTRHHVLIAAGSGITPMMSIAAAVLRDPEARVSVLYGNRRGRTVMFADELADLKDAHLDRCEVTHVLSREPREAGLGGRLDRAALAELLPRLYPVDEVGHWWLCGPLGLVTGARDVLGELGVPRERIHQELFYVGDEPPAPRRHGEEATGGECAVTITLDGRATTLRATRETRLLDAARRVRPDAPYACRSGVCGTCRAKVVSGRVDMRRNFALEPEEIAAGFVLTCQSVPDSDEITLDFDG